MPNGRSANVRSHRRGGGRGRSSLWLVIGVVVVLVAGGLTVGWRKLVHTSCTGMDTATVDAAPTIAPILTQLNAEWKQTHPEVNGRCVSVNVNAKDSALMALALGSTWDAQANGVAPDVWIPESSVWIQQASASPTAQQLMPDLQPSLARSPNVIAMPQAMAVALGWPKTKFDWPDIITDANTANFWSGKNPSWGSFKFTMTNPQTSTAGMLTLMSIADRDNSGSVVVDSGKPDDEQKYIFDLGRLLDKHPSVGDTTDVLAGLSKADTQSAAAATTYVSAFPAFEQDVIKYNENDPAEKLVAVYPTTGSYDADNPYLILNHPSWGSAANVVAAKAFQAYVRAPAARTEFLKAGFRDSNRAGDASFTNANGVISSLNDYLPRAVLDPLSVTDTLHTWTAATRTTNVLIVMDISKSMDNVVSGTGQTRLQRAQTAAKNAVNQFAPQSSVGLWEFSTNLDGTRDYKTLVPLGALTDTVNGGIDRRTELISKIAGLHATGDTGLYNTIDAAQKSVSAAFDQDATNLVVVITDGEDSPAPGAGNIDLNELRVDLTKVKATKNNVPIVTIGLGNQADNTSLQDIARTSGGSFFDSPSGFDIDSVLEDALFGASDAS
jgi:Ca-activated chloride channel homolog